MNTVIVPVDFSETSINAAHYATLLLNGHYGVNLILYHVYDKPSYASGDKEKLEKLKEDLLKNGVVKITTLAEEGDDFIAELDKLARHQQADMIIMGITGRSAIEQALVGSNALKMVKQKVCPVMIVPPNVKYKELKNVLLTSDFKNVTGTIPSVPIKNVLKTFHPNLYVMNVDSRHYVALTEEYQNERSKLLDMLSEFNPEFYFLGWYDVDEAIHQFAHDKNIDLIITIPRDHSLIEKMFRGSHTKHLVYQSSVPVLAVHE